MFDHKTSREHMSNTLPRTSLGHVVGLRCKWGVCAMNTQCTYQLALGGSRSNVREDATDESQIYLVWRSWVSFKLTLIMASGWQIMHTVHHLHIIFQESEKDIKTARNATFTTTHLWETYLGCCMKHQILYESTIICIISILTCQIHISKVVCRYPHSPESHQSRLTKVSQWLIDWLTDITSLESVMWR